MQTIKHLGFGCVPIENGSLSLLVTKSVGPRIISLRLKGRENLFAKLPVLVTKRPGGKIFHFYRGTII